VIFFIDSDISCVMICLIYAMHRVELGNVQIGECKERSMAILHVRSIKEKTEDLSENHPRGRKGGHEKLVESI